MTYWPRFIHARARLIGTTISSLVREAVRERYAGKLETRKAAMQAFVGLRKDRPEFADSAAYLRGLRRGDRSRVLPASDTSLRAQGRPSDTLAPNRVNPEINSGMSPSLNRGVDFCSRDRRDKILGIT